MADPVITAFLYVQPAGFQFVVYQDAAPLGGGSGQPAGVAVLVASWQESPTFGSAQFSGPLASPPAKFTELTGPDLAQKMADLAVWAPPIKPPPPPPS